MRDEGQADRYAPQLTVNYVDHHNPDLLLFDSDGEEIQRIDLTRLQSLANIHKLLKMLGVKEKCKDLNPSCGDWASSGQCDFNPAFMLISCRKACQACQEDAGADGADGVPCVNASPDNDCEYWSTMGECTKNAAFMKTACARSCGECKVVEKAAEEEEDEALLDELYKDEL